jgi:hypothetical protein
MITSGSRIVPSSPAASIAASITSARSNANTQSATTAAASSSSSSLANNAAQAEVASRPVLALLSAVSSSSAAAGNSVLADDVLDEKDLQAFVNDVLPQALASSYTADENLSELESPFRSARGSSHM